MKLLKMVQKVPGGLMVVPLLLGSLISLFFPNLLKVGGLTTATFATGASSFIGCSLFCVGSQINIIELGTPIKRSIVLLIAKFCAGFIPTLIVSTLFGPDGVLGITPLMLLAAVTNSNGGLYLGLMAEYGDENDLAAQSLLGINDGPFLTLLGMGLAGLANFDIVALLASIGPLLVGIVLGNLDRDIAAFFKPGIGMTIPFLAFCLGTGVNLTNIAKGGAVGIALGLLTIVLSFLFVVSADKFILRRPGYAGAALCTAAGNAVATPAILGEVSPNLLPQVPEATTAVAAAVIVTVILVPVVTSFAAKKWGCPRYDREAKETPRG
ncbi:MAG: 2-keto-3-deoxygluconate permease [Synergistaceae bacterium]|jgi:2-keto-3-deoxygluconate permease|nr:2-keto-3-deoxygluconate permease [Synergistaceae bacterium]